MSRWTQKQKEYKHTLWINKPKRIYQVATAQGSFIHECDYLDYKKTIQNFKKAGYTDINISFIGYNVTI